MDKCPHCDETNIVGPFEMDGYANGEYHAEGLFWIVCRECNRTSRVTIDLHPVLTQDPVTPDEYDLVRRTFSA